MNIYENKIENKNIKIGSNVLIGYIPQTITFENDNATILEVGRKCFDGSETYLRASLAKILFVSHDRYFINEIAKKIIYIEDKKIREYLGNYDDYYQKSKKI